MMGQIWLTRDNRVMHNEVLKGHAKGIYLGESYNGDMEGIQPATILYPDATCLGCYFNGRYEEFEGCYKQQLNETYRDDLLALITYSIFKGNNIIIYMEQTEVRYIHILLQVFEENYGVHVGDLDFQDNEFYIDNRAINDDICVFYLKGYMEAKEFINTIEVSDGYEVPYDVIDKMVAEDVVNFPSDFYMSRDNCFYYINDLLREETMNRRMEEIRRFNEPEPPVREERPVLRTKEVPVEKTTVVKPKVQPKKVDEVKQAMTTLFSVVKKPAEKPVKKRAGRPRKADKK